MSFRIDPRLPLTGEVRRILAEEIGKALQHLDAARSRPEQGLHKCRKRLKSARALLRLFIPVTKHSARQKTNAIAMWQRCLPARARRRR